MPTVTNSIAQSLPARQRLTNELHLIYRLDQMYRDSLSVLPPSSSKAQELWKLQNRIDSLNLNRVSRLLDSMEFPSKKLWDDSSREAAFMVIQHADISTQEKYISLFKKAAKENSLSSALVAMMTDRILVERGEKQIYGTQAIPIKNPKTGYLTDKYQLAPIKDEANINKRRAAVGLPSIEQAAKELGVDYKPIHQKKSGR